MGRCQNRDLGPHNGPLNEPKATLKKENTNDAALEARKGLLLSRDQEGLTPEISSQESSKSHNASRHSWEAPCMISFLSRVALSAIPTLVPNVEQGCSKDPSVIIKTQKAPRTIESI